ncbi:MAG: 2-oxoglutarate dehydrogenase E1 component [Bacteroidia bacterium]|nr:2-oxoglutarate dehydrogenase E1 component [Bacteroidia bacterium]MDW8159539.1 2-oxoglutarate dehydrogenase E1 component [Bacteroidia bacterium]
MDKHSYLSNADTQYIEQLYEVYLQNPSSIDISWQKFFEGFEFATSYLNKDSSFALRVSADSSKVAKEFAVINLINAYRSRGHLYAKVNPILPNPEHRETLAYTNFGLEESDLRETFLAGNEVGLGPATLQEIINFLETIYCQHIGIEYKYIRDPEKVKWIENKIERGNLSPTYNNEEKNMILRKLGQASSFENFLHRKFVGQKRFSLEGAESIIPALEAIIEQGAELGVQEFTIGMAHRGRLNVLTNILQKEYDAVFGEFTGKGIANSEFDGDVKYHLGYSSDRILKNGKKVHMSLAPNPSHLEAVVPVLLGITRAKMENIYDSDNSRICPILIHGDASLSGQGVVYEAIQMSKLPGYEVGGSVHIVINNQVGFTTNPADGRSSTYCTDVGKVTLSPVFHVNGDDPEAVVYVAKLAMEFRQQFKTDVFIDLVCYRKYGHNEGDEPRYTQPILYNAIAKHISPFEVYSRKLLQQNVITPQSLEQLQKELNDYLDKEWEECKVNEYELETEPKRLWSGIQFYKDHELEPNPDTKVTPDVIHLIAERISRVPENFKIHKNLEKLLKDRLDMVKQTNKIDWGMAEHLAYGSLILEGYNVRISGQDVERGTFSHRHAVLKDIETEEKYVPLNNLKEDQRAKLKIYNSLLSEFGVMGFELGYAYSAPYTLTIWEAQFGDFANGAQIIIDQFLSAGKTKWQRLCGLTLLLPHGYEGQGPEHSSARPERFLALCAENNMYVCNFTKPANLFHAFRRQIHSNTRRPLVVFTPKSLLRHPLCVSSMEEFTQQGLQEVYDDVLANPKKVQRVIFCTGKIYYDLHARREKQNLEEVALIRLEQLYPFPADQLHEIIKKYKKVKSFVWAQEEPENMGYWSFILRKFKEVELELVARKESASPATGSSSIHALQQEEIITRALWVEEKVKI